MTSQSRLHCMNRRNFLLSAAKIMVGLSVLSPLEVLSKTIPHNKLSFFHTHTGEYFHLPYNGAKCPPAARRKLFSFLRDFRTGDVHTIDFRLMEILAKIQRKTGSKGVYEVISGYRSPKTNKSLRSHSTGVAQKSLHLKGKAIDVRLTDLPTADLRDVAISLNAGGVGYYAESDFVHIDTGKVRSW